MPIARRMQVALNGLVIGGLVSAPSFRNPPRKLLTPFHLLYDTRRVNPTLRARAQLPKKG